MIKIQIDKTSQIPIYRQISKGLQAEISLMASGDKLPTIRSLAKNLNVNSATIANAYKDLEATGLVYGVAGSGVYVAKKENNHPEQIITSDFINFADAKTNYSLFSVDYFKNACNQVLLNYGSEAFKECPPAGYTGLCETISQEFKHKSTDDIQIITGINSSIKQFVDSFVGTGNVVLAEKPGLDTTAFLSKKAKVVEVVRDANGFQNLKALMDLYKPKFLFLMPNFQIPTSLCYTKANIKSIIDLCIRANAYIIEIDIVNDFYYNNIPPVSIKSLDTNGRVIYMKCFNKILASGLKIGYAAYPKSFGLPTAIVDMPSGFEQRIFNFYLQSNNFFTHGAFMRQEYGKVYNKLIKACHTYLLPYANFVKPNGGLGLWVSPKNLLTNEVYEKLLARKVIVSPGNMFATGNMPHFRLNFSNIPEDRITEGIGIISSVLAKG